MSTSLIAEVTPNSIIVKGALVKKAPKDEVERVLPEAIRAVANPSIVTWIEAITQLGLNDSLVVLYVPEEGAESKINIGDREAYYLPKGYYTIIEITESQYGGFIGVISPIPPDRLDDILPQLTEYSNVTHLLEEAVEGKNVRLDVKRIGSVPIVQLRIRRKMSRVSMKEMSIITFYDVYNEYEKLLCRRKIDVEKEIKELNEYYIDDDKLEALGELYSDIKQLNIPVIEPAAIGKIIKILYLQQYQSGVRYPVLLVGDPGVGKTQQVEAAARQLAQILNRSFLFWNTATAEEKERARKYPHLYFILADFRLASMEAADIAGVPVVNNKEKTFVRALLEELSVFTQPEAAGIIFLDELNRAQLDVMNAAMQILNEGRILDRKLPISVFVIAAANRPGICQGAMPLDKAVLNRFVVLFVQPMVSKWLEYLRRKYNPSEDEARELLIELVEAFLDSFQRETETEKLLVIQDMAHLKDYQAWAFASPRTWDKALEILDKLGIIRKALELMKEAKSEQDMLKVRKELEKLFAGIGVVLEGLLGREIGSKFKESVIKYLELNIDEVLHNFTKENIEKLKKKIEKNPALKPILRAMLISRLYRGPKLAAKVLALAAILGETDLGRAILERIKQGALGIGSIDALREAIELVEKIGDKNALQLLKEYMNEFMEESAELSQQTLEEDEIYG